MKKKYFENCAKGKVKFGNELSKHVLIKVLFFNKNEFLDQCCHKTLTNCDKPQKS